MTETDISKVLIEGEYATIMGVKYKRVEEPPSPVAEAYKDWWGQYPELETDSEYDDMRWQGFQAGFQAAYEEQVREDDYYDKVVDKMVKEPKPRSPLDEIVDKLVKEQQAQKLYNRLYDELGYKFDYCDEIVELVEDWLPKEHDTNSYKWNECLKLIRKNLR